MLHVPRAWSVGGEAGRRGWVGRYGVRGRRGPGSGGGPQSTERQSGRRRAGHGCAHGAAAGAHQWSGNSETEGGVQEHGRGENAVGRMAKMLRKVLEPWGAPVEPPAKIPTQIHFWLQIRKRWELRAAISWDVKVRGNRGLAPHGQEYPPLGSCGTARKRRLLHLWLELLLVCTRLTPPSFTACRLLQIPVEPLRSGSCGTKVAQRKSVHSAPCAFTNNGTHDNPKMQQPKCYCQCLADHSKHLQKQVQALRCFYVKARRFDSKSTGAREQMSEEPSRTEWHFYRGASGCTDDVRKS